MKHQAPLFALVLFASAIGQVVSPAWAADPVYPRGIRVGITPLVGLAPAKAFVGFETSDQGVKVLMTELPPAAYVEVDNALKTNPAAMPVKPEGIETTAGRGYYTVENAKDPTGNVRRYSMIVSGPSFSGYVAVQVPENAALIYTDEAVRQMFASVTVRKDVPVEEQLALLPFKIAQMSEFKNVRTLPPGGALLLADAADETKVEASPYMVIGTVGSAPEKAEDRARFAQQAAGMIPGLRDGRITMSEPIRIDGAPGFETRVDAVSGKDNTPVSVVQWLRFGTGTVAMRIIASSPRDDWPAAFTRFRAVRDGIQRR
jgi:hypothetical protein